MLRRYRAEIVLLLAVLVICFLAVRGFSQESAKGDPSKVTLKPGDEVKPLELESLKLGKLKAQIARDDAQQALLQIQFSNLENHKRDMQAQIDSLVKSITERVKKESGTDLTYDQRVGDEGIFRVATPPPAKK